MSTDIQEATLSHISDLKTISGTARSYWRQFDLGRKIMFNEIMSRPLRGYVDCEDCIEALVDYIRKATGKTVRITVPMRNLLVHMHSLRHQYKDGGLVSMSSVFAGKNAGHSLDHFRSLLEESGLIRMESGEWAYNPMDRQRNRAPKYRFTPEFTALLGLIHVSYAKGKSNGRFSVDDSRIRNVSIRFMLQRFVDAGTGEGDGGRASGGIGRVGRRSPPIISDKAGATQKEELETVETQGVTDVGYSPRKLMPESERKMRDKKLQGLWKGMTLSDMKKAGLADRCRLQCVSLGMGAEVDDFAFILALSERYREDLYSKIVRECDAALPEYVIDPSSGISLATRTWWSFRPKRDNHMNITKAGTRPLNDLCGTRNDMDPDDEIVLKPGEASRKGATDALHLPYHFDVHCSIHNLGRALTAGKFENADIYSLIAARLSSSRSDVKLAFMHACFGPLAEYCARNLESKKANQLIHHKDAKTKEDRAFPFTYRQIQDAMKSEQVPINGRYTEIFWHEAFIYDLVRLYLIREQGIASIRVYDSFYTRHEITETEFISLINRAIGDYLQILAHNDALLSIRL